MGYRHYFFTADKKEVEKISNMTVAQLDEYAKQLGIADVDDEDYFSFRDLCQQKEVFEFGKLYYEDTDEQIYSTGTPLFSVPETQERYSDYSPFVVGKAGLLKAIDIYKEKIKKYYMQLFEDGAVQVLPLGIEIPRDDILANNKVVNHIKDMMGEWVRDWAVNTDETRQVVTTSWKYEYSIFNLVFLLKTIDWEKQTLLFYGY